MKMLFVATMLVAVMPSAFALGFDAVESDLVSCTAQAASVGISCPAGTYFCGSDGCRSSDYLYDKFDLANKDGANWQATCYPKEAACGVSCAPGSVACGRECKIPQENPACTEQGLSTDPCYSNNCGGPLAAPAIKHSEESSYPSDRPAIDIVQKGTGALLRILNNLGIGITVSNAGDLETAGKVTGATGICIGADCIESWEQVKADWATLTGKPDNLVVGIGTEGRLARWGTDGIEDSIMTEAGNAIAVAGDVAVTGTVDAAEIISSGDIASAGKITATNGIEAAGIVKLSDLADCDTIDTDASGNLACGTDVGITNAEETDPNVPDEIKDGVDWADIIGTPANIVTGLGSENQIAKFGANGIEDSIIIETVDGFVGIGINPTEKLEIAGNIKASGNLDIIDINAGGDIVAGGDISGNRIIAANGLDITGSARISDLADCNTIDTDANGNLFCGDDDAGVGGSGTSDAIPKFDVTGKGIADSIIFEDSVNGRIGIGTVLPAYKLQIEDADSPEINVHDTTNDVRGGIAATDDSIVIGSHGQESPISIVVGDKEQVKINDESAAFAGRLGVAGDIKASRAIFTGDAVVSGNIEGGSSALLKTGGGDPAYIINKGDSKLTNKYFGIGQTGSKGSTAIPARIAIFQDDDGAFNQDTLSWSNEWLTIAADTGNVGIGLPNKHLATEKLEVVGNIKANKFCFSATSCMTVDTFVIAASRPANKLSKWTVAETLGDSIITDTGSAIGIGTTNPKQKLDVAGSVNIGGTHLIYDSANGVIDWGPNGNLYFRTLATKGDIASSYKDHATITADGKVGIGTISVEQVLHVSGASEVLSTGTGAGFKFRDRGSQASQTNPSSSDDWAWYATGSPIGTTARLFYEGDGGKDFITITQNGEVGIGKLPSEKLDVAGNVKATNFVATSVPSCSGKLITDANGKLACGTEQTGSMSLSQEYSAYASVNPSGTSTSASQQTSMGNHKFCALTYTSHFNPGTPAGSVYNDCIMVNDPAVNTWTLTAIARSSSKAEVTTVCHAYCID